VSEGLWSLSASGHRQRTPWINGQHASQEYVYSHITQEKENMATLYNKVTMWITNLFSWVYKYKGRVMRMKIYEALHQP